MNITELKTQRAKLLADARSIDQQAVTADRDLTPEEREQWNAAMTDIDKVEDQIKRAEAFKQHEDFENEEIDKRAIDEDRSGDEIREERLSADDVFRKWVRGGMDSLSGEERQIMQRAQSTTDSEGGYMIPTGFSGEIEKSMLAFGGMREACRVFPTDTGNDLVWPTVDDTSNEGSILAENTQDGEQDVTYSAVTFNAYKYTSDIVRVSVEILQDSAFNLDQQLGEMLGERLARITNRHFTVGTGTAQPNGAVTASGAGVTFTGNSAFTADALIELQHSVDPAYRGPNQRWMFHDSSLRRIRQLKDGNNQYLLTPGLAAGAADLLLGDPYTVNQHMPEVGPLTKPVLIGDFSKYVIRDVRGITLLRLVERYADYLQVGFIAFSRHDGDLLDAGTDPLKHGVFQSA